MVRRSCGWVLLSVACGVCFACGDGGSASDDVATDGAVDAVTDTTTGDDTGRRGDAGTDVQSDGHQGDDSDFPDVVADGSADVEADVLGDAVVDGAVPPPVIVGQKVQPMSGGVSARFAYEIAYDNVNGGDWYRDHDNETATLAWGESYVMESLAEMFRTTADPLYLERLAWHIDGVLAQRDDNRGVKDYRGVSAACWQNKHYQKPGNEPYCYVVHSGMIGYPIAQFVQLVRDYGLDKELAKDGKTFGEKATAYLKAAEQTVAAHDDQWNSAGYYVFRPDATFLGYPGVDLPLNQSNAMGRLLLALHEITGKDAYLDKAKRLAIRFKSQLSKGANGEYLWNYWGGAYKSPGEDISHGGLNFNFAELAAQQGVVFDESDMKAFAATFMGPIYVDDQTLSDFVGGGTQNGSSYRAQCGRWIGLTPYRVSIYAAVRDIYEASYAADKVTNGSLLLSWAGLAEFEPLHRNHFFYSVDWAAEGDWQKATAGEANVLIEPADLKKPTVMVLSVQIPRTTTVQQWDGEKYHSVLVWRPTGSAAQRWVPYEPSWPFVYWKNGVLYQFVDSFVPGNGIRVKNPDTFALPEITSKPVLEAKANEVYQYEAKGTATQPVWWSLTEFPVGARVDSATGVVKFSPSKRGTYAFTVRMQNDYGHTTQSFKVAVQ